MAASPAPRKLLLILEARDTLTPHHHRCTSPRLHSPKSRSPPVYLIPINPSSPPLDTDPTASTLNGENGRLQWLYTRPENIHQMEPERLSINGSDKVKGVPRFLCPPPLLNLSGTHWVFFLDLKKDPAGSFFKSSFVWGRPPQVVKPVVLWIRESHRCHLFLRI